jgi:hypothetical protein
MFVTTMESGKFDSVGGFRDVKMKQRMGMVQEDSSDEDASIDSS